MRWSSLNTLPPCRLLQMGLHFQCALRGPHACWPPCSPTPPAPLLHRSQTRGRTRADLPSQPALWATWCFSLAAQTPLEFLNIERHPPHGPLEARAGFTGPSQSSSRWAPAGAGAPSPLLAHVAGWDQQHRPARKSSFQPQTSLTSDILSEALPRSSEANSWHMSWGLGPNSD